MNQAGINRQWSRHNQTDSAGQYIKINTNSSVHVHDAASIQEREGQNQEAVNHIISNFRTGYIWPIESSIPNQSCTSDRQRSSEHRHTKNTSSRDGFLKEEAMGRTYLLPSSCTRRGRRSNHGLITAPEMQRHRPRGSEIQNEAQQPDPERQENHTSHQTVGHKTRTNPDQQ